MEDKWEDKWEDKGSIRGRINGGFVQVTTSLIGP